MSLQESGKRVAFYARVSTKGQTIENQIRELTEVAKARGWRVVEIFKDEGISGSKGRDKRPGFDAMLKGAVSRRFDILAAWSVDRLGRSLQHLVSGLGDLQSAGVDLYLHKQGLDTGTPSGRAMFGMLGIFAEFEREMIRERVTAGLARTVAKGTRLGRKPTKAGKVEKVQAMLAGGATVRAVADALGIGVGTVHRIKAAMA